ncbi:MAG: DUF4178 domain-containing protein [Desulfobacterales bacterium]|nr:MAG: DUF4178 domain-containing protein [Desulfobacterales bacterium]
MSKAERLLQRQFAHIRNIDPSIIIPSQERYKYTIKDMTSGGIFRLNNATYLVLEVGAYIETDESFTKTLDWTGHELKVFCLETGHIHNLEWEEDDEIDVSLTLSEVEFSKLQYDDGEAIAADSDDLDEIVDKGWEIKLLGELFTYKDDYAAWYTREGSDKREKVYFYDFEAEDGRELSIETWISENEKEAFQVFISQEVHPDDIEVMVIGSPNR